ncbi:ABC transporter permease [uncultured Ruminococcus sp.]|uniref:ABC transporter permease n=1 Tax=uncultured Ruminococcus sp. TaxID=165186 RepID=UPI00262AAD7E|nr:ABC transporter permease [uncultured Ruminococcus sp.]
MFLHNLKYEFLTAVRTKDLLIWMILFPIILGGFFKFAFDGIYEKTTQFSTLKTAVVDEADDKNFRSVAESLSAQEKPLLDIVYTDRDNAKKLLNDGDVKGIIYTGKELSLSVAENGIDQTTLKFFVDKYNLRSRVISRAAQNDPENVQKIVSALSEDAETVKEIPLTDGNTDNLIQYFYNLLAMVAMFGSTIGLHISNVNQANLSALGARKNCSPTPKSTGIFAALIASYIIETLCMLLSVTYLRFVLRIDFGNELLLVYLSAALAGTVGVSMGFCLGSAGRLSENAKNGISISFSLLLCFLSGLMVGSMKAVMARELPWFNKINPAAVISDSFYCLNMYSDHRRFIEKIVTMFILTAVFSLLGFIMTRRKKYASL